MSHIAVQSTKAGQPMFTNKSILAQACERLGLEIVETNEYRWYGRQIGREPLPLGMRAEDLGKNAAFVIRLNAENRQKALATHHTPAYEIGILEDPNNPGCLLPLYDYWNGGYGLDDVVGKPLFNKDDSLRMLCPKLKQHYDMCAESSAARAVNDQIEFMTLKAAHLKYPAQFSKTNDEDTWVSVARTRQRVGV